MNLFLTHSLHFAVCYPLKTEYFNHLKFFALQNEVFKIMATQNIDFFSLLL